MKFIYGKNDFKTFERGNEYTYLLSNALGGFSSTTIINSLTRNDHSLFMACTKDSTNRKNIISKVDEILHIGAEEINLSSQQYVCYTKNKEGFTHLHSFSQEYLPEWNYFYNGVEIKKTIVYEHGKNTLGIKYSIVNNSSHNVKLEIIPVFQFANRGEVLSEPHNFTLDGDSISDNNITLNIHSNYTEKSEKDVIFENDYYFAYDAVDGRTSVGSGTTFLSYFYNCSIKEEKEYELIFTLENENIKDIDTLINNEISRQKNLIKQAGYTDELAQSLVRASDQFIITRTSTNSKTILAGYPWFEDWGRDTMFAVLGSCIGTKRYDDAKNIFRTFIKYLDKGLMPNIFPEGIIKPLYNTADASLLYVYALYEYYLASGDISFVETEGFTPVLEIIKWYKKGTDFNIYMDKDSLIHAGEGLHQVTWMDVRFGEILPTARHGKPVEINAFWYNALKIASFFGEKFNIDITEFDSLSEKVKISFQEKFWNKKENCLKDVVSGNSYDYQVRSNQIWAVMVPFTPLTKEMSILVVDKVYRELYTPYGLRTLSKNDKQFCPEYGGSLFKRDMSYHQGTVWPFPLGGYFISYLKVNNYSESSKLKVRQKLECFESCLREGCVGQISEIYDGLTPNESRGCFAQAWSVSEILRVFQQLEKA
ncbi:amylo-alpha-1,6-glucosidase [Clostridium vincentii]|uniref:Amylo-alpha-1,6-glucosidase n=1 Tax=Clostridium vincentii TaxID=52704 RepID=A0A2T0BE51_9CLOT|nr:amylo-alpha-1,6-glucosidase [Clostridium vincentii]PRR82170.1 Amylo-alpha-1,6-glucosidase [Clostridium vincentii]